MSKANKRTDLIDGINSETIVTITDSAYTVTKAQSGTTFLLSRAAGIVVTMPDSGDGDIIGNTYTFQILTTASSNAYDIVGGTTDNLLKGAAFMIGAGAGESDVFNPGGTDHQIDMDAATAGWDEGGTIKLTCIAADLWFCHAVLAGTGTMATPFT